MGVAIASPSTLLAVPAVPPLHKSPVIRMGTIGPGSASAFADLAPGSMRAMAPALAPEH